jgi:hypothetical protein
MVEENKPTVIHHREGASGREGPRTLDELNWFASEHDRG